MGGMRGEVEGRPGFEVGCPSATSEPQERRLSSLPTATAQRAGSLAEL